MNEAVPLSSATVTVEFPECVISRNNHKGMSLNFSLYHKIALLLNTSGWLTRNRFCLSGKLVEGDGMKNVLRSDLDIKANAHPAFCTLAQFAALVWDRFDYVFVFFQKFQKSIIQSLILTVKSCMTLLRDCAYCTSPTLVPWRAITLDRSIGGNIVSSNWEETLNRKNPRYLFVYNNSLVV